jgi:hypothetical protein
MLDILHYIPQNARKTPSGWWTFNAPCCVHQGESRDKRKRGGVILDGENWSYHCFNCGFKTRFVMGQTLSLKTKKLLSWLGVPEDEIQRINLESIRNKQYMDIVHDREHDREYAALYSLSFNEYPLPYAARTLTEHDKKFLSYLQNERGLTITDYPFYVTPSETGRNKTRIIIPYYHNEQVVGWTSRYLDDRTPKYVNEHQQEGFIFGMQMQDPSWQNIIVTEGVFDAISISGVAVLHNELNEKQIFQLRRTGKDVIVVPDQDKAGLQIIQPAIDAGFYVSIPNWDNNIKDVNDAVRYYGKVGSLLSILHAKENNKIKIQMAVNAMIRRKIADAEGFRIHD